MHVPIGLELVLLSLLYVFNPFAVIAFFSTVLFISVHLHYQNEFKRAPKHYAKCHAERQKSEQTLLSTMFALLSEWYVDKLYEFYQWRNASPTSTL